MIAKEIILAGRPVIMGYCYATEIAYKELAKENIADYIKHVYDCFKAQIDPDITRTIYAILATEIAYYGDDEKNIPVSDKDMMQEAKPAEIGAAIITLVDMYNQFFSIPEGEPADDVENNGKGSAKN